MTEYIELDKNSFIHKGECRHVFLYPNDNKKCIKVALKETLIFRRSKEKNIFKRILRPFLCMYNENYIDIKLYKKLEKKNPIIWDYIPKFYGTVKTNLGDGIVVEYLTDENGAVLPTIEDWIKKYGYSQELENAINEVWKVVIDNLIMVRCPHIKNFLVKKMDNNKLKLYLVDGIGNGNFIPVNEWIKSVGRKKLIKKFNRFKESIQKLINGNNS